MARRTDRYKKRDSARSGFTYTERELVRDKGVLVGPDEFDSPPPSNKSLGGEGEVSHGNTRTDWDDTDVPPENDYKKQTVSPADSITFSRKVYAGNEVTNYGLIQISGASAMTVMQSNPQINVGKQCDIITVECVSNNIVLKSGSGLSLYTEIFNMDSGSLITLVYNTGSNVWQETSRGHKYKSIGEF